MLAPWPHSIIDNVIENSLFEEITDITDIFNSLGDGAHTIELVNSIELGVSQQLSEKIVNFADNILNDYRMLFSQFSLPASDAGYICKPQWCVIKNYIEPVHDDRYKDLSLSICIMTNNNSGIDLYVEDRFSNRVEFTQNAGVLFCSKKNVTSHSVSSIGTQIFLNIYFYKLDEWINPTYRNLRLSELDNDVYSWQKRMIMDGKLIRTAYDIAELFK